MGQSKALSNLDDTSEVIKSIPVVGPAMDGIIGGIDNLIHFFRPPKPPPQPPSSVFQPGV
jgi:hypothetical protein